MKRYLNVHQGDYLKRIFTNKANFVKNQVSKNELELVYGDYNSAFVVINKPGGLTVHRKVSHRTGDFVDSVEGRILENSGGRIKKVYFPHRLDKLTQGLMLAAFDSETCGQLASSGRAGQWRKQYKAMVDMSRKKQFYRSPYLQGK